MYSDCPKLMITTLLNLIKTLKIWQEILRYPTGSSTLPAPEFLRCSTVKIVQHDRTFYRHDTLVPGLRCVTVIFTMTIYVIFPRKFSPCIKTQSYNETSKLMPLSGIGVFKAQLWLKFQVKHKPKRGFQHILSYRIRMSLPNLSGIRSVSFINSSFLHHSSNLICSYGWYL